MCVCMYVVVLCICIVASRHSDILVLPCRPGPAFYYCNLQFYSWVDCVVKYLKEITGGK